MKNKLIALLVITCICVLSFGAVPVLAAIYGDLTYSVSDGEVTITDCNTSATNIVIPETIAGYPVTTIGERAFSDCFALTSVTIGNSVTTIGDRAFSGCNSLNDVYYTGSEEEWNSISISSSNTPLTNATIHYNCLPSTKTVCATAVTGEKMFVCIPSYLPEGAQVILTCYMNGKLVDFQYTPNKNENMEFIVDKPFDSAKVMLWRSLETANPICNAEVISLGV